MIAHKMAAVLRARCRSRCSPLQRCFTDVTSPAETPSLSSFADVSVKITEPRAISKRRRFNEIPLDGRLMRHLDDLDLGFASPSYRRRQREKLRATSSTAADAAASKADASAPAPAPFDRVGKQYARASAWGDLPRNRSRTVEVALAGRSNVGKSTLLNVLLNLKARPQLRAAVSATPGETQDLAFFAAGGKSVPPLAVVDLPGYGFAFAPLGRVGEWTDLTITYLRHRNGHKGQTRGDGGDGDRQPLKRLLLLVDARHGLKVADREFLAVVYDRKVP